MATASGSTRNPTNVPRVTSRTSGVGQRIGGGSGNPGPSESPFGPGDGYGTRAPDRPVAGPVFGVRYADVEAQLPNHGRIAAPGGGPSGMVNVPRGKNVPPARPK
jgi:hypothetical protein